jgi:hypothetical protein
MFRFTIRDMLWLTVVVALAVGWSVDWRTHAGWQRQMFDQLVLIHDLKTRNAALELQAEYLKETLQDSYQRERVP